MKLYYSPGACSMAVHIMLKELAISCQYESVDLKTHKTQHGVDYYQINPKGYVPALMLDHDGGLLTEATAILFYLSEQKPTAHLNRVPLIEWLSFLSSEVHKNFGPLFHPDTPAETIQKSKDKLRQRFQLIDHHLARHEYLLESSFGPADAYLYTLLTWCSQLNVDISQFKNLEGFFKRITPRPAVQQALKEEGLAKS